MTDLLATMPARYATVNQPYGNGIGRCRSKDTLELYLYWHRNTDDPAGICASGCAAIANT